MSYLSVDLDYWMFHASEQSSLSFFKRLARLEKAIVVVKDHQKLLPDIHENWPRDNILYNVDVHSDISGEE